MTAKQGQPSPTQDYTRFPVRQIAARTPMWHAHSTGRGAWYFDNGDFGRFNLRDDRGTCYTATDVQTAVREKLRDEIVGVGVVPRALAESFQVSEVTAPATRRCAAVSNSRAVRHGIVRAMVTMEDYSVPQEWARMFDAAGFDGVFYASAYTTGEPNAYALFGPEGSPGVAAGYEQSSHLAGSDACAAAGIEVEDPPTSREVDIIS